MFPQVRLAILLTLVTCVIGQFSSPSVVRGKYLVETANQSVLGQLGGGGRQRRSFYDRYQKRDITFVINKEYNEPGIFVGGVIEIPKGEDVSTLAEVDGVISVQPVRLYLAPKSPNLGNLEDQSGPTTSDSFSTHIMTGVDKAHAQGFTGSNITIGIIDTGVDYTHSALGGGFGPRFKIAGGWDFVGDNYNGTNTAVPDPDPLDQCNGHGTHVAGIIGANPGNQYNISGVAYNATLYAYRVLGCNGGTESTVIIDALLRGYKDELDILTLSLGAPSGFSEDPVAVVASRIAKTGTVITAAVGNSGDSGSWYIESPATGKDVISVGSVDNTIIPVQNATIYVNGEEVAPIPYIISPLTNATISFEIYATSTNTSSADDACEPLSTDTPDLTDKVVIIRRGTCSIVQKCENAANHGASRFIIYNYDQSFVVGIEAGNFSVALIQADTGAFLVNNFAQGKNVTVSFTSRLVELPNTDTGGLMSSFSSLGPSYELDFKPSISSPGGNILSTLPNNTFGVKSGTSMSTPFVAGSAALVLQARGKTNAVRLAMRNILESTASPIASNLTDPAPPQTLIWSGAGLVQVDRAINTQTLVNPGHLTLNDTAHFQPIQKFTITNLATGPVTYNLTHVPAGTIYTYDGPQPVLPPYRLTADHATVEFSRTDLTVNPGELSIVTAKFTAPAINATGYPAYSGYIEITSPSETLRVSYLGVLGSVRDQQLLDHSDAQFNSSLPLIQLSDGSVQNTTANYTFVDGDYPTLVAGLLYGSPQVSIDLVTADSEEGTDPVTVGNIELDTFVARTLVWEPFNLTITEQFNNGSTIPDGEYRLSLKALKIFGNPNNTEDWETYLSQIIGKVSSNETATPS